MLMVGRPLLGLLLVLSSITTMPTAAFADTRVALVIGNATYENFTTLRNPHTDARAVAAALEELGFDLGGGPKFDLEQRRLEEELRAFRRRSRGADVSFFYYSGHGIQVGGDNRLVGTDAILKDPDDITYDTVPDSQVLSAMRGRINIAVFDACRENPFERQLERSAARLGKSLTLSRGLGRPNPGRGTLVALAAAPGEIADDGPRGGNSPYAAALVKHLRTPGLRVVDLFRNVRVDVETATEGQQQPETIDRLPNQPVILNNGDGGGARVPSPGTVFRDCSNCPEMVVLPRGSFTMGSPSNEEGRDSDEGPQHRVTIGYDLAVGKYEVTFDEWNACVADGGCRGYRPSDKGWGRGRRPVIKVSWDDAKAYVGWLSRKTGQRYRLLSEAEWEYAARAGTTTAYWWGRIASHDYANYGKDQCCGGLAQGRDRWEYTAPVGRFRANGFGLHDMLGNVWEWTEDCWNGNYNGAPVDGGIWTSGQCEERVLRGGSWDNNPRNVRSADRIRINADIRVNYYGFRVARTF